MKEYAAERLKGDGIKAMESFMGSKITLKWLASSSGTWDDGRQEYVDGTDTWITKDDIPCFVKTVTGGDVRFGRWGFCEQGDLIVCINKMEDITNLPQLRLILNKIEYKVMVNTKIPFTNISALIGNDGSLKAVHARYIGDQQGVV